MDDDFEFFLGNCGPAIDRRYVPPSSIERYRGKLPDQLLAYWDEHGWCGYADGAFWTIDPQEYEPALEAWIGETPFMENDAYHLIARSAFGELFFWGERTGHSLTIRSASGTTVPRAGSEKHIAAGRDDVAVRRFFASKTRKDFEMQDEAGRGLFASALAALGQLKHDEMYGFVPALALGGAATLKNMQKVKAVEHLVILAQMTPVQVMKSPFEA